VTGVIFNEAEHSYTLDGKRLPSVTQILDRYNDFSMVREEVMATARERGSLVHLVTQLYDEDDLDESSVDPLLVPYLEGWKRFRRECEFTPRQIEYRGAHPLYGYAGTLDRLGTMSRHDWLLDIKGGLVPATAGLQTAAYVKLLPANFTDHIRRATVQLKGDGTYALLEWKNPDDWAVFLSMLNVFKWLAREDKRS
jgi:hypothetical protein